MRQPTPHAALYAWHSAALAGILGDDQPLTEDPQCGWYKRRLVKNGIFVPARIWMYQPTNDLGELIADEVLQCEVDGKFAVPDEQWTWLCSQPISESHFRFLVANRGWAEAYAPDEPYANPRQPVDWRKVPIPTFKKEPTL